MSLIEEEISIGSYLDALGEFADEDNLQAGIEFINDNEKDDLYVLSIKGDGSELLGAKAPSSSLVLDLYCCVCGCVCV
jgi:hypothetical protein